MTASEISEGEAARSPPRPGTEAEGARAHPPAT